MGARPSAHRNLWTLTVLSLLREGPMHPYEMQRLIRQRKKDDFLDLKRGSLYNNIERLQRAGLIESVETRREGKRPERTVYRLTEAGERELLAWLRELLLNPARDSTEFVAALSFLAHLPRHDVLEQLSGRAGLLEAKIRGLDASLRELAPRLGRLLVVEAEYRRAMRQAELAWVRSLIDDIRRGDLTWKPEAFFPRPAPPA
jgi:DNA-binding PadR family transcriptional regulator